MGEPLQNPTNKSYIYVDRLNQTQIFSQISLIPIEVVHAIPMLKFTLDERQVFTKKEGLHQVTVVKLSMESLYLSILRSILRT